MPDSPRLPERPSLEQLRKQAKELSKAESVPLAHAQFELARKLGFESWAKLKHHVESLQPPSLEQHERLAQDLVAACTSGDAAAVVRLNDLFHSSLDAAQIRGFVQQRLNALSDREPGQADFGPDDARLLVARLYGFESWERFVERGNQPPDDPRTTPLGLSSRPPFYKVDV